ncbi:MAG TPA: aspartate aminotransferase family protein [Aestuariivirgaceae bacterium]|nr:aspartate aminotransferase family protein [Aestuariivirgaceae bacterium]
MLKRTAAPKGNAATLEDSLAALEEAYVRANPTSRAHMEKAGHHLPGGNTRSVLHFDPFPLVLAGGEGPRVRDVDGHVYTDFLGEYSAGLYGHSHPVIVDAVKAALDGGIVLGGTNPYEYELARLMTARFSLERVRFCNSGTEANMLALCLARAATGRDKVLVFNGAYHGSGMSFSVKGPSLNLPFSVLMSPFNDLDAARATIDANAGDLAAVIVEPMMGGAGCIPGEPDFLAGLRAVTARHGVLLVFDEVMTSRCSPGGYQRLVGVTPDLTTFGKYLGGGMSFGAFGGRRDLMDRFDPSASSALPHSGTFNNNVLSMAAGAAGLSRVLTDAALADLNARAARFRTELERVAERHGIPLRMTGAGSLQCMHFQSQPVRRAEDPETAPAWRKLVHLALVERGFYTARRGYSALSLAITDDDVDRFVAALDDVLESYAPAFGQA